MSTEHNLLKTILVFAGGVAILTGSLPFDSWNQGEKAPNEAARLFLHSQQPSASEQIPKHLPEGTHLIPINKAKFCQAMNDHGDMLHNTPYCPDDKGDWPPSPTGELRGSRDGQFGIAPDGLPGWDTGLGSVDNSILVIKFNGHPTCCMGPLDEPLPEPHRRSSAWFGGPNLPVIEIAFGESKTECVILFDGKEITRIKKEKNVWHTLVVRKLTGMVTLFLDGQELKTYADGQPIPREFNVRGSWNKGLFGGQGWSGCEDPTGQKTGADCWYGGWANFEVEVETWRIV